MSRCIVVAFGVLSGVLAIVLMKIGLSLGWVYLVSVWGSRVYKGVPPQLPQSGWDLNLGNSLDGFARRS